MAWIRTIAAEEADARPGRLYRDAAAPGGMKAGDLDPLRAAGLDDREILELNRVVAHFAYANRTVLGLGVDIEGEEIGLPPAEGEKG